jgi:selenocysteine-specific elongation factor
MASAIVMSRSIVIGTAGHIDHGKSSLVRALTGTDPDRLKEEKARGITIDLGFAHLEADGINLAFVDVPGHERFVKNMLAGAGGIDLVMMVVAADESVMPQTREHFQICRLLHVPAGLIVLTKTDVAGPEMTEIAALEVRELARHSFLENAPVLPVSSKTGEGLDALRTTLKALAGGVRGRRADGPARMPIDRVFTIKGFGTVVTGTLLSGSLHEEQDLAVLPAGRRVKVRGLQVHGRGEARAEAGRRVAVNLGGVDTTDVARGDTLAEAGAFSASRRIDVAIELLDDARPLKHGARVRFHQGTSELLGRVAVAGPRGPTGSAAEIAPGGSAFARIRLESPAVVTRGDRFILRAYSPSITIGGGAVLDPHPPRSAIRTASGLERMRRLDADMESAVMAFVDERGGMGLERSALVSRAGLSRTDADAIVAALEGAGRVVAIEPVLVSSRVLDDLSARLVAELESHHRSQPLSAGLPREEARERVFGHAPTAVFDFAVQRMVGAGRLNARDRLSLPSHQVSLTPEESRVHHRLEEIFRDARLSPPDAAAAATVAHAPADVADRMLKLLVRNKTIVKVDTLYFHSQALEQLKADVRALEPRAGARVDVASFKERYGISRKYAIPLLEFLDRERITKRVGDARIVL